MYPTPWSAEAAASRESGGGRLPEVAMAAFGANLEGSGILLVRWAAVFVF